MHVRNLHMYNIYHHHHHYVTQSSHTCIIDISTHVYDIYHHHHVTQSAQISLTVSCQPFLSSIAFSRSSSHIGTELLYVVSSWLSCLCTSLWRAPQEYIPYELILTSPEVSRMSGLPNFDSFWDRYSIIKSCWQKISYKEYINIYLFISYMYVYI